MAAAAVIGVVASSGGKAQRRRMRLFTCSRSHLHCSTTTDDHIDHTTSSKNHHLLTSSSAPPHPHPRPHPHPHPIKASSSMELEAVLLFHRSILENQWNLSPQPVVASGISARKRRHRSIRRNSVPHTHIGSPKSLLGTQNHLLTHAQVVHLSNKIKAGLLLQDYKSKLKEILGYDPSHHQLATSLHISPTELHSKLIQSSLATQKLAMSNVRLVMSIAQKYDNLGAQMPDLIQGGLIGLVHGIEKFDSSKGFKISTYVYWWIRQGVLRALVDSSRTLRLPMHMHERLGLIHYAKLRLEEKGVSPSVERIAEFLNMSQKKVQNATEAVSKVFSLDRDAFPSLNGLPGETFHSYVADNKLENNPWHEVHQWTLKISCREFVTSAWEEGDVFEKAEVNNLISTTLGKREQDIVRLYYGMDDDCITWEDISKRMGLSRERVRQVGLVAMEKLKYAARRRRLEAMLAKH